MVSAVLTRAFHVVFVRERERESEEEEEEEEQERVAYAGKRSISVFQLLVSIPPATPSVRVAGTATYAATTYAVSPDRPKLPMTRKVSRREYRVGFPFESDSSDYE